MATSGKLFVEMECSQLTKGGETACGDDCRFYCSENENRYIAVLSDGLGSGIKANLLSTMTTTMAILFVRSDLDLLKSIETIMDSLPVCEVRKISYATFTIIDMQLGGRTRVIEMGNPQFVLMRGLEDVGPLSSRILVSERWPDRAVQVYELDLQAGDRLVVCSDGVTQAGLGITRFKMGWRRSGLVEHLRDAIAKDTGVSARDLSHDVTRMANSLDAGGECKDDISCMVIYIRHPRVTRVLSGPPFRKEHDAVFAQLAAEGGDADHVAICGGTTANIVARELGLAIQMDLRGSCGELPPTGRLGNALVTEGVLTLTRLLEDLEEGKEPAEMPLAAQSIATLLLDSDCIEFIVGTKVNEAHQDPDMPMDLELRRSVVKRLRTVLESTYRKKVTIRCF